jgi:hypothetical protein
MRSDVKLHITATVTVAIMIHGTAKEHMNVDGSTSDAEIEKNVNGWAFRHDLNRDEVTGFVSQIKAARDQTFPRLAPPPH